MTMILKTSAAFSSAADDRLADDRHGARAEVGVGQSEHLQHDADDALEVELLGQLQAGPGERAEEPVHQALLEVGRRCWP